MTANRILDEELGGEDGESPIRFRENPLRDASEVTVGRITRDHRWDRRYKPTYVMPEPIEPEGWRFVVQVIGGMVIFGGMFMALWFWLALAAASQT